MTFLHPIAKVLEEIAPSVWLDIVPFSVHEVEQKLELRQVDFVIDNLKKSNRI